MSEPGTGEHKPQFKNYAPEYILSANELDSEGEALIADFMDLLKDDPDAEEELAEIDSYNPNSEVLFKKGEVIYKCPSGLLRDGQELASIKNFNLLRYDENNNEEDLTIVRADGDVVPKIEYKTVFAALPEQTVPYRILGTPRKMTIKSPDRDYSTNSGLAISGAREMLDRARKDFAKK